MAGCVAEKFLAVDSDHIVEPQSEVAHFHKEGHIVFYPFDFIVYEAHERCGGELSVDHMPARPFDGVFFAYEA